MIYALVFVGGMMTGGTLGALAMALVAINARSRDDDEIEPAATSHAAGGRPDPTTSARRRGGDHHRRIHP